MESWQKTGCVLCAQNCGLLVKIVDNYISSIAQELTGFFWCAGRLFGRQNAFPIPDEHHADMLLAMDDAPEMIKIRHIADCMKADPACGEGVAKALDIPLSKVLR